MSCEYPVCMCSYICRETKEPINPAESIHCHAHMHKGHIHVHVHSMFIDEIDGVMIDQVHPHVEAEGQWPYIPLGRYMSHADEYHPKEGGDGEDSVQGDSVPGEDTEPH